MGEQGITNAIPFLLNTSASSYRLGLSCPGITFFTTNTFNISDTDSYVDFNSIPTYNSSTDIVSFSYSGSVSYVELYKVGYPANNRRFIDASAHIVNTDILGTSPNYSVDITNVTLYDKPGGGSLGLLVDNGGTYYMGLKPSANPFTISGFFDVSGVVKNYVYVTGYYSNSTTTLFDANGVGHTTLSGDADAFIAKYSDTGYVQWATRIAGSTDDFGYSITTNKLNNIYVSGSYGSSAFTLYDTNGVGHTTLSNSGLSDAFIAKYSDTGYCQWGTYIGGTGNNYGYSISASK